jgi:hypothetical protein
VTEAATSLAVSRAAKELGMRRHSDFYRRTRIRLGDLTEERALAILANLKRAREEPSEYFPPRFDAKREPIPYDEKETKRELFALTTDAYRRLWYGDDATDGPAAGDATDNAGSTDKERPVFGQPPGGKSSRARYRERDEILFGRSGQHEK